MSGVRGNLRGLYGLNQRLRQMARSSAIAIASKAAPAITGRARSSFDSGMTVYGSARPKGKRGALSLVLTGATRAALAFASDGGTKIRAVLGSRYMKYLIGKYTILPSGGRAALPAQWKADLSQITRRELERRAPEAVVG